MRPLALAKIKVDFFAPGQGLGLVGDALLMHMLGAQTGFEDGLGGREGVGKGVLGLGIGESDSSCFALITRSYSPSN